MICSPVCGVAVDVEGRVLLGQPPHRRRRLVLVALRLRSRRRRPSPARAGRAARSRPPPGRSQSTSPARVSFSFAIAPMSPAPSSVAGRRSLPSGWPSWPIRSFSPAVDVDACESERDRAAEDAEEVDPAGVGVGEGLEDVGDQRPVLVGLDLDRLAARRRSPRSAPRIAGEGRSSTSAPSSRSVPRLRVAAPQVTGKMLPRGHAPLERRDDLLVVDLLALEVALHQLVGVLRDLVHQLLPVLLGLRRGAPRGSRPPRRPPGPSPS